MEDYKGEIQMAGQSPAEESPSVLPRSMRTTENQTNPLRQPPDPILHPVGLAERKVASLREMMEIILQGQGQSLSLPPSLTSLERISVFPHLNQPFQLC